VTGMPSDGAASRGYQGLPLSGSPAARLLDDTARLLASGRVPRCPHPGEPAFWYLPAGILACAPCLGELAAGAGHGPAPACQACAAPAAAVAAWVTAGVPCLAALCEACHTTGLVPVTPN
jgi:hypothetical protein